MNTDWFSITAQDETDEGVELRIYEPIYDSGCEWFGGVCPKQFTDALQPYRNRAITVRINSPGGDAFAGTTIYNYLKDFNVTTVIDGLAASIASIIAMAGKRVLMARNAWIMIHEPSGLVIGTPDDMRDFATELDQMTNSLADTYARETGQPIDTIKAWMKQEKWFNGEQALEFGFVDALTDEAAITASFDLSKFQNVPRSLRPKVSNRINNRKTNMSTHTAVTTVPAVSDCGCQSVKPASSKEDTSKLQAENLELKNRVEALETERDSLKKDLESFRAESERTLSARAEAAVDAAIADGRLSKAERSIYLKAYQADEAGTLAVLKELKPPPPGTAPLRVAGLPTSKGSIQDQISAEPDPRKRIAMYQDPNNWRQLMDLRRD